MLAPHELKNAEFSKSLRGYSTAEVDEHIEFIIEKYTELYRLNDELEKRLRLTEAQLDALKAEEESIKSTLVNAQKASMRIIGEANERADVIMRSAKNSCDRILAELKANVEKENERLRHVQTETASFKAALFEAYRIHIGQIESIAPDMRIGNNDAEQIGKLSNEVLERIKADLAGKKQIISGSDDPFTPVNTEDEIVSGNEGSAEKTIPDIIDDTDSVKNDDSSLNVRDENDDFISEKTVIIENGSSLIDSIRKINENAKDGYADDDDFLSMLTNTSSFDATSSNITDEFELVYDSKKKGN